MLHLPDLGLALRAEAIMGGAVVWPAAYALCHWLKRCAGGCCVGARCVELGASGGEPGLVALGAGASHLLSTDGDASLLPVLEANCAANCAAPSSSWRPSSSLPPPPSWSVAALDWREMEAMTEHATGSGFDLVLATDVLYSVGGVVPLVCLRRVHTDAARRIGG